jgi:hypothetical protein
MEEHDICWVCGKPISKEEGRVIEHDGFKQAHPICYWQEQVKFEERRNQV